MSYIHGHSFHPLFNMWRRMVARCNNPKDKAYPYYGGRNIKVAKRWLNFNNFVSDVGKRPTRNHSLDRFPDNDGDYRPGNTRWATRKQQQANTRKTRYVTFRGKKVPFCVAYQELGLDKNSMMSRVNRLGWDPQRAIDTPVVKLKILTKIQRLEIAKIVGISQTKIAEQYGCSQTVVSEIKRGVKRRRDRKNPHD